MLGLFSSKCQEKLKKWVGKTTGTNWNLMCVVFTLTHTPAASYPSLAVRQISSPSWHSFTVVKPGSSTSGAADTRGGAGGGGDQLPQHSPSAEPSETTLASRAKPGWRRGVSQTHRCPRSLAEDQVVDVCPVFFVGSDSTCLSSPGWYWVPQLA